MPETRPLKIVAIGGGTGLSSLLSGLKRRLWNETQGAERRRKIEITAVVTVTDDGGSSGRLRRDFDVLPPGDIRRCMVALSEDSALLSRLFQYRFPAGRGLKGHSFGNLFLTALWHLTGDFARAVTVSSDILTSAGRIHPSTASNVNLRATLEDGTVVRGETRISRSRKRIERIELEPERCKPLKESLLAIAEADLITLGPGSLFTSIVPNLLVAGIPQAIRRSAAVKAYFINLMWQPGETMGFTASDHVKAIYRHAHSRRLLDAVVVNTAPISVDLKRRYAAQRAMPVETDMEELRKLGVTVIRRELVARSENVRHDPDAIAAVAVELASVGRRRRMMAAHG
jgi:uncharacterized cofD-like protein